MFSFSIVEENRILKGGVCVEKEIYAHRFGIRKLINLPDRQFYNFHFFNNKTKQHYDMVAVCHQDHYLMTDE